MPVGSGISAGPVQVLGRCDGAGYRGTMQRLAGPFLVVVAVATFSAACTSSETEKDDPPSGATSSAPTSATRAPGVTGPDCAEVWQPGETLPADYTACADGATQGKQDVIECLDDTRLIVHDDVLWGVTGQEIVAPDASPLQDTERFGAAYATCTGE